MADSARRFDGLSDHLITSPGGLVGYKADSKTYVAVLKRNLETSHQVILSGGPSNYKSGGFMFNGNNQVAIYNVNSGNRFSPFTALSSEGWVLIAVSLGAANAIPRFHKYVYDTDTWVHDDGAGAFWSQGEEDRLTATDELWFGRRPSGGFLLDADVQAAGVFDGTLSDVEVEGLAFNWFEWEAIIALGLWRFDQAVTTDPVLDDTDQGADQTILSGTTVATGLAEFSFDPPLVIDPPEWIIASKQDDEVFVQWSDEPSTLISRTSSDGVTGVSDGVVHSLVTTRAVNDTVEGVSDSSVRSTELNRVSGVDAPASEVAVAASIISRVASDSVPVIDSNSHEVVLSRQASERIDSDEVVTNGRGELGDNINFSQFTWVGPPDNGFRTDIQSGVLASDELFEMDPFSTHYISAEWCGDPGVGQRHYVGLVFYDIDQQRIQSQMVIRVLNTGLTVLTQDLAVGDTTVWLEDTTNWETGTSTLQRRLALWPYVASSGLVYTADHGYTRHVSLRESWDPANVFSDRIVLNAPWSVSVANPNDPEGIWRAGTVVGQHQDAGTYNYVLASNNPIVDDNWVSASATVLSVEVPGVNTKMWPGTRYATLLFLTNRTTPGGATVYRNLSVLAARPSDIAGAAVTAFRTGSDTAPASDVAVVTSVISRVASDTVEGVSDSSVRSTELNRVSEDTAPASEVAVATSIISRLASDVASATDEVSRSSSFTRVVVEPGEVTDNPVRTVVVGRIAGDVLPEVAIQSSERTAHYFRVIGDVAPASDDGTREPITFARGAEDVLVTDDGVDRQGNFIRDVPDDAGAVDGVLRSVHAPRESQDEAPLDDEVTIQGVYNRQADESLPSLIEEVQARTGSIASANDSAPVSDETTRSVDLSRMVADEVSTSDGVQSYGLISRDGSDVTTTSDGVERVIQALRGSGDALAEPVDDVSYTTSTGEVAEDFLPEPQDITTTVRYLRRTAEDNAGSQDALSEVRWLARTAIEMIDVAQDESVRIVFFTRVVEDEVFLTDLVTATVSESVRIAPKVTITSVSTDRVSRVPACDSTHVTFSFDQPVVEWVVRTGGTNHLDGTLLGSWQGDPTLFGLADITGDRLRLGQNEVEVYARSEGGPWSVPS